MPQGVPRTDTERAMAHYGISEAEYLANPSAYPLPERGSGPGSGLSWGWIAVIVIAVIAFFRGKKART
jgi:hypothetical protein